jgi:hypothetical protein
MTRWACLICLISSCVVMGWGLSVKYNKEGASGDDQLKGQHFDNLAVLGIGHGYMGSW